MELKPSPNEAIGEWFTRLLELKNQVDRTAEAITPVMFKTHVFTSLPDSFEVTSKIQQNNPEATIEEIIEALKEDEKIRGMRFKSETTNDAFVASRGRGGLSSWPGKGRGRGFSARGSSHATMCSIGIIADVMGNPKKAKRGVGIGCDIMRHAPQVQKLRCSTDHKLKASVSPRRKYHPWPFHRHCRSTPAHRPAAASSKGTNSGSPGWCRIFFLLKRNNDSVSRSRQSAIGNASSSHKRPQGHFRVHLPHRVFIGRTNCGRGQGGLSPLVPHHCAYRASVPRLPSHLRLPTSF